MLDFHQKISFNDKNRWKYGNKQAIIENMWKKHLKSGIICNMLQYYIHIKISYVKMGIYGASLVNWLKKN